MGPRDVAGDGTQTFDVTHNVAQAVGNITAGNDMSVNPSVDPNTDVHDYEELVASLRLQVQQRDQFIRANG